MKIEFLIWIAPNRFKIVYDEKEAIKKAKRMKAGEVEKCIITGGGLIVESEVIWRRSE